jgi:hypothetical protein
VVDVPQVWAKQRDRQPALLRLRPVAGLIRALVVAALALLSVVPIAAPVLGIDSAQTTHPPTCAERFPEEGPAGVDLRLGCIVSEVVGLWRPDAVSPPPTLSTYAVVLGVLVAASVGLGLVLTRMLARRAGARLAPSTPGAWWVCPACHSINGLRVARCYNCAAPRPPGAGVEPLLTGEVPTTPQSFGRGKHE